MKKVCIMGLGYIGLPTAIVAAESGYDVIGYDIDSQRVTRINSYDPVIEEPSLKEKLLESLRTKRFRASTQIESADFYIIAVPTPFKDNHKADLSCVWQAADSLLEVVQPGQTIILESTVPVGATDELAERISKASGLQAGVDFFVAHCPERVLPGNIFYELVYNARIVGGINKESVDYAATFYKKFVKAELYLTNATTAEMVKLVENSSRDVAIAFANQVADMAYKKGLNPFEVIELANKHPRVSILNPSCGVGGHCIAVDPWFLIETFPEQTTLLQCARNINDTKPEHVIQMVKKGTKNWREKSQHKCHVLLLGLTYKPDVDDIRESPALKIAQELCADENAIVSVCDPYVEANVLQKYLSKENSVLHDAIEQADMIVCLVKHKQFKHIQFEEIQHKTIFDFCGLFYEPHAQTAQQHQLYWPASNLAIRSIIDYAQGEL